MGLASADREGQRTVCFVVGKKAIQGGRRGG